MEGLEGLKVLSLDIILNPSAIGLLAIIFFGMVLTIGILASIEKFNLWSATMLGVGLIGVTVVFVMGMNGSEIVNSKQTVITATIEKEDYKIDTSLYEITKIERDTITLKVKN